jgi:esterase/lipase
LAALAQEKPLFSISLPRSIVSIAVKSLSQALPMIPAGQADHKRANELLDRVGLADRKHHRPSQQMEELAEEGETTLDSDVKTLTRKFVSTVRRLQKEAHDVIRSLETRFESAIRIGDSAIDHAVTLRRIADSLYARSIKQIDESDKAFVKSKSAIAKLVTRQESVAKRVMGGDRAGWR